MLFAFLTVLTFFAEMYPTSASCSLPPSSGRTEASAGKGFLWLSAALGALPGLGYIHSMERGVYLLVAFAVICHRLLLPLFSRWADCKAISCRLHRRFRIIRGASDLIHPWCFPGPAAAKRTYLLHGPPACVFKTLSFQGYAIRHHQFDDGLQLFLGFQRILQTLASCKGSHKLLLRNFAREHFMEAALLLLLSMLYYRNALGRSDATHVAYVLSSPIRFSFYS